MRRLTVGDIHGHIEAFEKLLKLAEYSPKTDQLYIIGDYIDRGPDSRAVLDKVMGLVKDGAIALMGNHEDLMLRALMYGEKELWFLRQNGGAPTFRSYRDKNGSLSSDLYKHLNFIKKLPLYHEEEDVFITHAGVRPGISLKNQTQKDLLWIRDDFIYFYKGPKRVVAGHTPVHMIDQDNGITPTFKPKIAEGRLLIDTGAAYGGPLSIVDIDTLAAWQVPTSI